MTKKKRNTLADVDLKPLEVYTLFDSVLPTDTGIYAICNIKNGKFYIGSARATKDKYYRGFHGRFNYYNVGHRNRLLANNHHCKHLQNCFNKTVKDGLDPNDVYQIWILEFSPAGECIKREQLYLDTYRPTYNCSLHAIGGIESHSLETRLKISKSHTGKIQASPSLETRKKMSLSMMGKGAKDYIGINLMGEIIHFSNAYTFAKANQLEFSKISACASRTRNHHKGWLFFYAEDITEDYIRENMSSLYKYVAISPEGKTHYFAVVRYFAEYIGLKEGCIFDCLGGFRKSNKKWKFYKNPAFVSVEVA